MSRRSSATVLFPLLTTVSLVLAGLTAPSWPAAAAQALPPAAGSPAGSAAPPADPPPGRRAEPAKRVKELTGQRTAYRRVFALADGRVQQEVSAAPLHYRDGDGGWRAIDTKVLPTKRRGFAFGNESNGFRSFFGAEAGALVRFEAGGGALTFGVDGAEPGRPEVRDSVVTYAGALGEGTDLVYEVGRDALKEKIVLSRPPAGEAVYRFAVRVEGLRAWQRPDGSIAFHRGDFDGPPVLVMPKPFMVDSADDASSPYGKAWSGAVSQSMSWDGERLHVTVTADRGSLSAPGRRYPVVIDPTVKIAPPPTQSQDTMIMSDSPDTNHDASWRLSVGTTDSGVARSLLKFPLTEVPSGTRIESAQLQLWYDQQHTANTAAVTIEARRATGTWDETSATWNNASALVGELGANTAQVDDGDPLQTAATGSWTASAGDTQHAVNGDFLVSKNATTGDAYTWYPMVTEPGTYRVDAHYVTGPDRAANAPYTVSYAGGTASYPVNQSGTGAAGVWRTLGSHPFVAGTTGTVRLGDVADASKAVVADAVRLVKEATAVRPAGDESSAWHSFSVRGIVQGWLDGSYPNHGFVLKARDENTPGAGGPRYEGSVYAYNGETATYPRLVLTYGRPGVEVKPPRTIQATGAELSWPAYTDPCAFCPDDDLVEYQVHRSVHQTFTPSAATLVAPLAPPATGYTDTSAPPTAAEDPDPFGNAYYYMVAVRTRDGQVTPGPTQLVRLPKAGRVTKIYQSGVSDTTLSSALPDTNLDRLTGQPWLSVGNNSATHATTRALLKFPDLGIPSSARVLDAEVKLWTAGVTGSADATWELRGLSRDFTESTATWSRAAQGTAWTTPGGDHTAVAGSATGFTNDPRRRNVKATSLVAQWVANPATNRGMLLKLANETTPLSRAIFLSGEAGEAELTPQLVVTYLQATPESTYHVPDSPPALTADTTATIPATVTNTTPATLSRADWVLSYQWTRPDGTPVSTQQLQTPLPRDLPTGDTVTVAAQVKAPPASAEGNRRADHVLAWNLYNKTSGTWLSAAPANPIAALSQTLAVQEPTSDQIGLEKFYAYSGKATGAGASLVTNLSAGNAVWSYNAFTNPSRGVATFVRLAYNSADTSDSTTGFGWSLQASSLVRLATPLDFHPNPNPTTVTLTDGDGTSHRWTSDGAGQWTAPAGVNLRLQRLVVCGNKQEEQRAWVMTRPDRTQFFYDCQGYPTSIADNNGNRLDFTYEVRKSNNQPTKFLRYLTDPAGRRTLTLDYHAKGEAYDYIDDTTWTRKSGTSLTNPHIIDHVKQITDLSGRKLTFAYTDKGLLGELIDGAGSAQPKVFTFAYDMTQGNKNVKLVRITDPRGNATAVGYHSRPEDPPAFKWQAKTITDRLGGTTTFAYTDPDGNTGRQIQTVVTDAHARATTYLMDGLGRPVQVTDAKNQVTKLGWDAGNNVVRLEEANAAVTTWAYDPKTGYPTEIRNAEANKNGWPGTVLTYQTGLNGYTADLTGKRSPEGRAWSFGYTPAGDLASVTDPAGTATPAAGDYTTTYTYDSWGQLLTARDSGGNTTSTAATDFDPSGYPKKITDPLGKSTTYAYDPRGQVTEAVDPLGAKTTQTYDVFGRPLEHKAPKDQAAGVFVTTPAPVYDANDNVTRSIAPNGAVTDAVYDKADQVSHILAPKDNASDPERRASFTYDRNGNLLTQTEPKGNLTPAAGDHTTTYAYDELYQLSSVTNAKGHKLSYTYDNVGNLSKVFDPRKNATPDTEDYTAWYWYDLNHRVRAVIDATVKARVTDYDRDGLVVASTDETGNTTRITLDARGKPAEVRVPHRNDGGTVTYRTIRYEYDQVGNRTKVVTPRGAATSAADDFVHQTVYDQLNRVKERLTPYDPADARYRTPDRTIYSYDAAGRLATVSAPPSNGQTVRNDTRYTYWDNGWAKTSTDPWDIATYYDYNALGEQTVRVLGSAGGSSSRWMVWDHYPDGKLKSRSDLGVPVGNQVVLVDDSDQHNVRPTGTWTAATTAGGFHGHGYRTHAAGAGSDAFEWTLNVPQAGDYQVFVRYPAVAGASTTAPFKVTRPGGVTDKPVDQTRNAGTWVSLGTHAFTEGNAAKVSLTQSATGVVVADAVKLVRNHSGDTDNERKDFGYAYDPNGNLTSITDTSPGRRVDSFTVGYTELNQVGEVKEHKDGTVRSTTSFTYNPNGAPETTAHDGRHARYDYDPRDLVSKVTSGRTATDPAPKITTFTYTDRGERLREVKGNGNTVDHTYYLDGLPRTQVEKKPGGTLVSEHTLAYDLNGNRVSDAARTMNADDHAAHLATTAAYTYDPRDRIATLTRTGAGAGTESYVHDANDNVVSQTVKGATTTFGYDRNRLLTAVSGSVTAGYNYDPFGRLDTVSSAGTIIERRVYDGFDRLAEHREFEAGGTTTTRYAYDPLDRTAAKTTRAGTAQEKTTSFDYLGLSGEVLDEEVAGRVTRSYQYSPWGERLSQISTGADGTEEPGYYGYNAHTDVEQLTGQNGDTRSTYGYTAYGQNDDARFTGVDKPDTADPAKEPDSPYRFNAKRWDQASGDYDMGFREYSPGLNRFLTRDMYTGALADLNLTANPFTGNLYAFGGGNPISNVELDGHIPDDCVRGGLSCGTGDDGTWRVEPRDPGPTPAEQQAAAEAAAIADITELDEAYAAGTVDKYTYTDMLASALAQFMTPRTRGSVTIAVGMFETHEGEEVIAVSSSESRASGDPYFRASLAEYLETRDDFIQVGGTEGHAEIKLVEFAKSQEGYIGSAGGWKMTSVGASRPICQGCARELSDETSAMTRTRLRDPHDWSAHIYLGSREQAAEHHATMAATSVAGNLMDLRSLILKLTIYRK
ncbi:DNRLRE domain-containing protein [Nonomuraea cavernae]|uniref:golvesin C-terminal-like domain-containing protein n=1 Tax=Nonomuraea cavernae TaxID=2045107 RepID=UPI0033ED4407